MHNNATRYPMHSGFLTPEISEKLKQSHFQRMCQMQVWYRLNAGDVAEN